MMVAAPLGRAADKGLLDGAACKHRHSRPPLLSGLTVGNNSDHTAAKDTPGLCISGAFLRSESRAYPPPPTL